MGIKAALLDERGVYLCVDELEDATQLTDRHLPQIRDCDLPAGRYVWITDERKRPDGAPINEYGGAFWELAWLRRVAATRSKVAEVGKVFKSRSPEIDAILSQALQRGLVEG